MTSDSTPSITLVSEAKAAIWRIFGAGESPSNNSSAYGLIDSVLKKYTRSSDLESSIREVRGWFDSYEDQRWLKSDLSKPVAELIIQGIRTERGETAVWAAGAVAAEVSAPIVRSAWSAGEVDSFTEATISTLEKACHLDQVIDATRCPGIGSQDSVRAQIPKSSVVREGCLRTFMNLDTHGFELVHHGVRPVVRNLVEFVIALRPVQFQGMILRLDHPVVQTLAAHHMVDVERQTDHRKTLEWITERSCESLIALAIVNTLNAVNRMDDDIRSVSHRDGERYISDTEPRPSQDDLDAGVSSLLSGLVARLSVLDPRDGTRWIGELLSGAPYILHAHGHLEIPRRIEQLEGSCTDLLARLTRKISLDEFLAQLRAGLCQTPRTTWTRHIADLAWELRGSDISRAVEIAQFAILEDERQVSAELRDNHMFLDWSDYNDREWMRSLGAGLALSQDELPLSTWVFDRCRMLPLSVWDAEEDYQAFMTANRAAEHWFLIALHAIAPLQALGRPCDSQTIRVLSEALWTHCHFAGQFLHSHPANSIVSEYAARVVTETTDSNDAWLLDMARNPGVGARALWGLIHQRKLKTDHADRTDRDYEDPLEDALIRVAQDRFYDDNLLDFEALRYWAQLWLSLEAADESEHTAMALIAFRFRPQDRPDKILVLKLLALASTRRRLSSTVMNFIASLYGQIWPGYTPREERSDREKVDSFLNRSHGRVL